MAVQPAAVACPVLEVWQHLVDEEAQAPAGEVDLLDDAQEHAQHDADAGLDERLQLAGHHGRAAGQRQHLQVGVEHHQADGLADASDPRLPFGEVKRSGYGRDLAACGIRELTHIQAVWIGPATGSQVLNG